MMVVFQNFRNVLICPNCWVGEMGAICSDSR